MDLNGLEEAFRSQIFGGGVALMLAGAAMALLRNVPARLLRILQRQVIVSVDVIGGDPLFDWLTVWLDAQPYSRRTRLLTASGRRAGPQVGNPGAPSGTDLPPLFLTPAPGSHVFWYGGRPIWLSRERKEINGPQGEFGGYRETITLRMVGRSQAAARALLEEARLAGTRGDRRVGVYIMRFGDWYRVSEADPRPLDSVALAAGLMEELKADAETFFASREKYRRRGIPWYRRYLLEGPPGNGKTSAISALAAALGLDLYLLVLSNQAMTDERLIAQLTQVPERSAVLLEDVDCVVEGREVKGDGGVTFSGLLNALDGVASRPGCLVFMSTNHPENLDPALVRKGRVDVRRYFAPAVAEQAARRFMSFYYEGADPRLAWRFGEAVTGWSMVDVQHLLLAHADDPVAAVGEAERSARQAPHLLLESA